ncbi:MAG: hypothetical protein HUU35_14835 [Armatimonadetes bacterium]|nr:hypothetical protein [Armatimonadota bacterium]
MLDERGLVAEPLYCWRRISDKGEVLLYDFDGEHWVTHWPTRGMRLVVNFQEWSRLERSIEGSVVEFVPGESGASLAEVCAPLTELFEDLKQRGGFR